MNATPPASLCDNTRLPDALLPVHGHIDAVHPTGTVHGWCAAVHPPFGQRRVTILLDGQPALTNVACDMFRKDLLAARIGDGNHGFRVDLPQALLVPGGEAELTLRDEASGLLVGQAVRAHWPPGQARNAALEGHIDQVTAEGMVVGWCWDRAAPERRVIVNVLVDGSLAGSTPAGVYRDDLRDAGKGTGHCGFSLFLPWNMIASRGEIAVTLQDHETCLPMGQRVIFSTPKIVTTEQRIDALERQLQLVRAELHAAELRAAQDENAGKAPELFRIVAAFFQNLAEGRPYGNLSSLRARLDDAAGRYELIPLNLPQAPVATIFVLPDGRLDHLHACLDSLHRAGADMQARVVVLDLAEHDHDDTTLIPALARNAMVMRLRPGETVNDILASADTQFWALLPCHVAIGPHWLDRLLQDFANDPAIAVAATALRDNAQTGEAQVGTMRHLVVDPRTGLFVNGAAGGTGACTESMDVDAIDDLALVMCADAFNRTGGLDLSYSCLAAQLLEYCLRVRRRGYTIRYHREALAAASFEAASLLDQSLGSDVERLRAAAVMVPSKHQSRKTAVRGNGRATLERVASSSSRLAG